MRLMLLTLLLAPSIATALPRYAVRSIKACDTCHVEPTGWSDPESMWDRKCTLDCAGCHVSPTGGGMRTGSGIFYGRFTLPTFAFDGERAYQPPRLMQTAQPPANPTSQPAQSAPAPGSAARYAGIPLFPALQVGADIRVAGYHNSERPGTRWFPMQTDLSVAWRPYNPREFNAGRITLLASVGAQAQEGLGPKERPFIREWWAMLHDLPGNTWLRAGRFLPAFGWRLADHTAFTRKSVSFLGKLFDFERQVTGAEVGINPNYWYGSLAGFLPSVDWDAPFEHAEGDYGVTLNAGFRGLPCARCDRWPWRLWPQAGLSVLQGRRGDLEQFAISAQGGLNLHLWWDTPLTWLGELVYSQETRGGQSSTRVAAMHEVVLTLPLRGTALKSRYDWQDSGLEGGVEYRVLAGAQWVPFSWGGVAIEAFSVDVEYRRSWRQVPGGFLPSWEFLVLTHLWR